MKFCKDCKHYVKAEETFARCGRTEAIDPVSGNKESTFCNIERQPFTACCGPEAKFFEPATAREAIEIA